MKVAIINNVPKIWGLGKYADRIYNSLKKKIKVDNIYLDYPNRIVWINNKKVKLGKVPLIDNKVLFMLRAVKQIPKYDIYHLTSQNLSFLTSKLKRKGKVIITCHDIYHHKEPKNYLVYQLSKILYSGLKKSEKIIASTNATKQDMISYLGINEEKIKTIHLASDPIKKISKNKARKIMKLDLKEKIIMHVGELSSERKNAIRIIKAVESLKDKINIRLVRVGEGEYKSEVVNNYYKISEKEMNALYNSCDVLITASTYDIPSLPLMEAMKLGKPVISSDISSIKDSVKDAPHYIDPSSVQKIAKGIKEILTNSKLRAKKAKMSREAGKKITWDSAAREIIQIYNNF